MTTSEDDRSRTRYRIGEVAERCGVSTRTLRYYQELGLIDPSGTSPGGSRRYSEADVERLSRILELRSVMGFDLDRIGAILTAEDRLATLREEVTRGISRARHQEIVIEALRLNQGMRDQVRDKLAVLEGFLDELDAQAGRMRTIAEDLGVDADQALAGPDPDPDPVTSG